MAQVKIYARRAQIDRVRAALSDAIHGVFMAIVGLPEDKRFHRFIALDDADFIHPADRGGGYTVIKIVMFEGRSDATKRALLRGLMTAISDAAGVPSAAGAAAAAAGAAASGSASATAASPASSLAPPPAPVVDGSRGLVGRLARSSRM